MRIARLYEFSGGELLALTTPYGPVVRYDLSNRRSTVLGTTQVNPYDALRDGRVWYIAGYPAATLRWDPSRPWTLSTSTPNPHDTSVNPHELAGFHRYHWYLARGAEGTVFVGVHHERDSQGGELGWYDTRTGAPGSLRAPFERFDVAGLASATGGTRIVYASRALDPGVDGRLFIIDADSKRIEHEVVPLPGVPALDAIVETRPGVIVGIGGGRVYAVDVRSGDVLYTRTLPGVPFKGVGSADHRLVVGPDGNVWLPLGDGVARIDPETGTVEPMLDVPARGLLFVGSDLYLYGDPVLRRVRRLFSRASAR